MADACDGQHEDWLLSFDTEEQQLPLPCAEHPPEAHPPAVHPSPQPPVFSTGQQPDVCEALLSGVPINKARTVITVPTHKKTLGIILLPFFCWAEEVSEQQQLFFLKYA